MNGALLIFSVSLVVSYLLWLIWRVAFSAWRQPAVLDQVRRRGGRIVELSPEENAVQLNRPINLTPFTEERLAEVFDVGQLHDLEHHLQVEKRERRRRGQSCAVTLENLRKVNAAIERSKPRHLPPPAPRPRRA